MRKKLTHEEYLQRLKEKNIGVVPIEKYAGKDTKIKHLCICGNVFSTSPAVIYQNRLCGCGKTRAHRLTHEEYLQQLKQKNIDVIPLEKYEKWDVKIKHLCVCGNVWAASPNKVLNGRQCGCRRSLGEKQILHFLNSLNIEHEKEKIFSDLPNLRFDFAIYSDGNLITLIEYQGRQHFNYMPFIHKTEENFNAQLNRDQMKRDYAAACGVPLIEITYKEKDVIAALEKELRRLGVPLQLALL